MTPALIQLLEKGIDDAGLFPPEQLALKEALARHRRLISGPEKWIVNRFVCPAGQLEAMGEDLLRFEEEPVFSITAIGRGGSTLDEFQSNLDLDAVAVAEFNRKLDGVAEVESFETRLPMGDALPRALKYLLQFEGIELYGELGWGDDLMDSLVVMAEIEEVAAKGRTGGVTAEAFPTTERLAEFLQGCANLDLPFKLTAGLHHPLPHYDEKIGVRMHGFLNIFVAFAILTCADLSRRELVSLLEAESLEEFAFKPEEIRWREFSADREQIANARAMFPSYGSCSIREPLEGLAGLGLIDPLAVAG